MSEGKADSSEPSAPKDETTQNRISRLKQMLVNEEQQRRLVESEYERKILEIQLLHKKELEQILQTLVGHGIPSETVESALHVDTSHQCKSGEQAYQELMEQARREVEQWNKMPWFFRAFRPLKLDALKENKAR